MAHVFVPFFDEQGRSGEVTVYMSHMIHHRSPCAMLRPSMHHGNNETTVTSNIPPITI